MITNNIFLYHLDYEMQKLFRVHTTYSQNDIYSCFKLITRLAYLLSTESIIIPASNYFESDIAFKIINELAPLNEYGVIKLTSSSLTLDELLDKKEIQHSPQNQNQKYHYHDFRDETRDLPLYLPGSLITRERSASNDIREAWLDSIGKSSAWAKLYENISANIPIDEYERILFSIPELLEKRAFISEYILPFLPLEPEKSQTAQTADTILNIFITKKYVESFLIEYDALCFSNIPIIDSKLILPNSKDMNRHIPFNRYAEKLHSILVGDLPAKEYINQCNAFDLITFKNSALWKNTVLQVEEEIHSDNENHVHTRLFMLPSYRPSITKQGGPPMKRTLIITALQLELDKIIAPFKFPYSMNHEVRESRHYYSISPNAETMIVCTAILGMGQVNAAVAIKDALSYMPFDRVILAGICGGLSEQLNMGDIIVSEKIVDYELAKIYDNEKVIRWNVYNSDHALINDMKSFSSSRWREQLADFYPAGKFPKVHFGTVLSGNKVMASREEARSLAAVWDKSLAIEMEASGIANALYQTSNAPPFIMVKSVCDLADKNKNDDWQSIAAKTAAVFVIDFVFSVTRIIEQGERDQGFSQDKNILFILKDTYNLAELNELCFNIGVDIEDLGGQGKSEKALELVKYCKRRRTISALISQINRDRGNVLG